MSEETKLMATATCQCEQFVTGGIHLDIETDAADGRRLGLRLVGTWPRRTAVSKGFVRRLTDPAGGMPGAAEWQKDRLIIRANDTEIAYRQVGVCEGCGYIMVERD